ncbi:MAG: FecR family protein [Candidatus Promineifilaceae bacterium]
MITGEDQLAHITFEQLADYQEGTLIPEEATFVETHLAADCHSCQDDLAWLKGTVATMRSYDWEAPPAGLRAIARRNFREHFEPVVQKSRLSIWLDSLLAPKPRFAMAGAVALMAIIAMGVALITLAGQGPELAATVADVTGLVELQPAGSHKWLLLRAGAELQASDRIRSAADGSAVLRYPDDSVTEIGADTQLAIVQLSATRRGEGQIVVLHQNVGQTRYAIKPQNPDDSWFEVETSAASFTVIGTEFAVEVTESQITIVSVTEGTVEVSGEGSTIRVEAGQTANVLPGAEPAFGTPSPTLPSSCAPPGETRIHDACGETAEEVGSSTTLTTTSRTIAFPEGTVTTTAGISNPVTISGLPTPTATPTSASDATPTATYPPGTPAPGTGTPPTATPTSGASIPPHSTATPTPPTAPPPTSTPPPTPTSPPPTATTYPPTSTPIPPTPTPIPPTPIPPTPIPPTSTPYPSPPTSTPPPPTPTPNPPTATPPPPTPTPAPYP